MDDIRDILIKHKRLYPLMQFEDIYKLIFQHCYGPKHMNMSKGEICNSIIKEASNCHEVKNEVIDIGNNFFRVSIISNDTYIKKLANAFYKSTQGEFRELNIETVLKENFDFICNLFQINKQIFDENISVLKKNGFPPISHSEIYKENYSPHYRVIHKEFLF